MSDQAGINSLGPGLCEIVLRWKQETLVKFRLSIYRETTFSISENGTFTTFKIPEWSVFILHLCVNDETDRILEHKETSHAYCDGSQNYFKVDVASVHTRHLAVRCGNSISSPSSIPIWTRILVCHINPTRQRICLCIWGKTLLLKQGSFWHIGCVVWASPNLSIWSFWEWERAQEYHQSLVWTRLSIYQVIFQSQSCKLFFLPACTYVIYTQADQFLLQRHVHIRFCSANNNGAHLLWGFVHV